jgi:hypothetical protein
MLETSFPRIPGNVENAETFKCPVRYRIVVGASPRRVVKEVDLLMLQLFIEAAQKMVHKNTSSCDS